MSGPAGEDDTAGVGRFLSRWSQRKRASAAPEVADPAPSAPPEPAPSEAAAPAEVASETAPPGPGAERHATDPAELPRIEDLTGTSDLGPFLNPGVPAALRSAALRRVWLLNPAIRDHVDPAVDYAWDWNTPGGVPGDGLAPSAERAAAMLRDLLAKRGPGPAAPPDPAAPPPGVDAPVTPVAVEGGRDRGPSPPADTPPGPVAGRAEAADSDPPAATATPDPTPDPTRETTRETTSAAGRRRHGGALPG